MAPTWNFAAILTNTEGPAVGVGRADVELGGREDGFVLANGGWVDAMMSVVAESSAPRATVGVVIGTRPEAIKVAPVVQEFRRSGRLNPIIIGTGQHADLLGATLAESGLALDVDLGVSSSGRSLTELAGGAMIALDRAVDGLAADGVMLDAIVVQGDTTSAFAAGLVAFHRGLPLIHLEAGLRSDDRGSPFPEEINRRMITLLAGLHLAPTVGARDRLIAEGVAAEDIVVTGNTVVDALLAISSSKVTPKDPRMAELIRDPRRLVLLTTHRRESWGEPMSRVVRAVDAIARERPDVLFAVPCHPNPRVRRCLLPLSGRTNVVLTAPLPHAIFVRLLARADLVLTDSGGVQEEAPTFGVPVLVLRDSTERVEGVDQGLATVVGTSAEQITAQVRLVLDSPRRRPDETPYPNPYGDGQAARRCVAAVADLLGLDRVDDERAADAGSAG